MCVREGVRGHSFVGMGSWMGVDRGPEGRIEGRAVGRVGRIASQGVREVCEALGRRRRALYSEAEAVELSGLSVERLRAVEAGEYGVSLAEIDALVRALAVVVPLPKQGRSVRGRGPGWWLTEEQRREGVESGRLCGSCFRVRGKVRGCGCGAGGDASGPRP